MSKPIARRENVKLTCGHCNKAGQVAAECFQLIGYPEWWYSGKEGQPTIGRGSRGGQVVNTAQIRTPKGPSKISTRYEGDRSAFPWMTNEQWNQVVGVFNGDNTTKPSMDKLSGKKLSTQWLLDTGASNHLTGDLRFLTNVVTIPPCSVGLPDGTEAYATKAGTVKFDGGLMIHHVLFVPKLTCNLISVFQLIKDSHCTASFADKMCILQDHTSRMVIGVGEQRGGVYVLRATTPICAFKATINDSVALWHKRLGHASHKIISTLPFVNKDSGLSLETPCDICFRAKQTRTSFDLSISKADKPFALIHCDLWGPYRIASSCGARYFLTIVDDCSRAVWIYLLSEKSEVSSVFPDFCNMVKTQFETTVKILRSDNGLEFIGLRPFLRANGILHQTSCIDTAQQNGRAERKHRHILNVARALRFQANLPLNFWGECVLTAGHLINRTPTPILKGRTPYEVLFGKVASYSNLKTFGCLCYVHHRPRIKDKFNDRSRRCMFVGYPFGQKGWKVYDLEKGYTFVSRDVVFFENVFPFIESATPDVPPTFPILSSAIGHDETSNLSDPSSGHSSDTKSLSPIEDSDKQNNKSDHAQLSSTYNNVALGGNQYNNAEHGGTLALDTVSIPDTELLNPNVPLGRGHRSHKLPAKFCDYEMNHITTPIIHELCTPPATSSHQSKSSGMVYPIANFVTSANFTMLGSIHSLPALSFEITLPGTILTSPSI